ncbi:ATP-binding protein [Minwuia sp.]|uniref:sensor histidine kinase n=1 Tax=Minwuia sp. TaxID=2493630 RepID=UPI003A8CFFCC
MARSSPPDTVEKRDRRALGRTFTGLALLSVLSVLILSGLVIYLQDRNARQVSVDLVQSALLNRTDRQAVLLEEYGYWDAAVEHIVTPVEPDLAWLESEIGAFLHTQSGVNLVRIFDGAGNEKARVIDGVLADATGTPTASRSEAELIETARRSPDNEVPRSVSAYTRNNGELFLTSAIRMTDYDDERDISTDHVMVFSKKLDPAFLASIEKAGLVRDLTIAGRETGYGEASVPLPVSGGDPDLKLIWKPNLPGTAMIPWMLAALTAFIVVVIAAGAVFMRRMAAHAEALDRAREISEQANRQKSGFLANMSHELRTPLNAVIGFADIMRNQYLGPVGNPRYLEYATDIRNSGEHLLSLVNGLLDMSKIESGHYEIDMEAVDLREILSQSRKMVEGLAEEKGVDLVIDIPDTAAIVMADEKSLRQVLINLMNNAVKFTPAGGRVSITSAAQPGGRVVIRISDTGIGIREKDLELILEPFYQVESRPDGGQRGTGLGLSVSRKLVELMGGSLLIESTVGQGTAVSVTLPADRLDVPQGGAQSLKDCA